MNRADSTPVTSRCSTKPSSSPTPSTHIQVRRHRSLQRSRAFHRMGRSLAISANENGLHEPTANALALARRINAKFPQIPVRLTHSLFVHLLDIAANRQIAAQAPNAEQRSGQFTMNCFLNPLKYATIAQS